MPTCIQIIATVVTLCGSPTLTPQTPAQALAVWQAHDRGSRAQAPAAGLAHPDAFSVPATAATSMYGLIPAGHTYAAKQAIVEANYQASVLAARALTAPVVNVVVTGASSKP